MHALWAVSYVNQSIMHASLVAGRAGHGLQRVAAYQHGHEADGLGTQEAHGRHRLLQSVLNMSGFRWF